jgi:hypothetical protein
MRRRDRNLGSSFSSKQDYLAALGLSFLNRVARHFTIHLESAALVFHMTTTTLANQRVTASRVF